MSSAEGIHRLDIYNEEGTQLAAMDLQQAQRKIITQAEEIDRLKHGVGGALMIFGSAGAAASLLGGPYSGAACGILAFVLGFINRR